MFSNFLETHSRSFSNPFDDLIDKQIYDIDKLDLDVLKVENPPPMVTKLALPAVAEPPGNKKFNSPPGRLNILPFRSSQVQVSIVPVDRFADRSLFVSTEEEKEKH